MDISLLKKYRVEINRSERKSVSARAVVRLDRENVSGRRCSNT